MRTASVHEIKQELLALKTSELAEICLRLAKFKKENKELLTYLLFEAHQEENYLQEVKKEMDEIFAEINFSHLYFVKKSLRKLLRQVNKHSRYIGSKAADAELRLYFCSLIREKEIALEKNTVIKNMYFSQLEKAKQTVAGMHEDLQYDFLKEIRKLEKA